MTTWADVVMGDNPTPKSHPPKRQENKTPTNTPTDDPINETTNKPLKKTTQPNQYTTTPSGSKKLFSFSQSQPMEVDIYFGDDHKTKLPKNFRFVFNNINGITLTPDTLINFAAITKELQSDWTGIAETHIASDRSHVRDSVLSILRSPQGFEHVNAVFSSSDAKSDDDVKFGGILQFTTNTLASRTVSRHSNKYGWFTSQTLTGRNGKMLTTITAYRVTSSTSGIESAYAQQRVMLVTEGRDADPRNQMLKDLTAYILTCQESGHDILLCIDANESMSKCTSKIRQLADTCNLLDVHANLHPDEKEVPSFVRGSEKIDFCLATPHILECITRSGILVIDDAYMSDHRTMFLDLDVNRYFNGITPDTVGRTSRSFTTKNKKLTGAFSQFVSNDWTKRKLSGRIKIMDNLSKLPPGKVNTTRMQSMWDKVDLEIGNAIKDGEKSLNIPTKSREWSPALAKSGAECRYWKARIYNSIHGRCGQQGLVKLAHKYAIPDDGTTDRLELEKHLNAATRQHAFITKRDVDFRDTHTDSLIAALELQSDPDSKRSLKDLKALKRAEKQSQTFSKIRRLLKPSNSGAVSRLDVPQDMAQHIQNRPSGQVEGQITNDDKNLKDILQRTIKVKRQDGAEVWETLVDKAHLESSLLMYCEEHYQQATTTPLGSGYLAKLLGTAGLTEAGQQIIDGTLFEGFDDTNCPELSTFLAQLAMPEEIKNLEPIKTEISLDEYKKGFRSWKECTSTSPSGRHLGIYKALLHSDIITSDMCTMLNVAIRLGLVPSRWCQAISVLIEKDPGNPNINRLRIIHLFEADFNLFLKIIWASRLVQRGEESSQFGEAQQGSRPRRAANDAVLLKRLTYDLSRILRTNLGTFDNDAKSCYDRIINAIAMLAAKRLGMPDNALSTHAGVLWAMKYSIKTMFGISDGYYASGEGKTLFGTGQGSGASPAAWLTISTVLLASLRILVERGMLFKTPDGTKSVERYSDAFVDDAQNGLNDAHLKTPWTLPELSQRLEDMSQTWEKLLFCSGGSLEPSKCFYYLIYWKWVEGLPQMMTKSDLASTPGIKITSGFSNIRVPIRHRDVTETHVTLGARLNPLCDDIEQVIYLKAQANRIANLIITSNLSSWETFIAYRYCWIPSVTYLLPTTTMTDADLHSIQTQATGSFLLKMGFNRKYPRVVCFGPLEFGGLTFRDLFTEQGALRIKALMEHIYHDTETGQMIMIAIQSLQMEAGTSAHILTDPTPLLVYIEPCWISAIRDFMATNQLSLEFTNSWNFRIARDHDVFLMDVFRLSGRWCDSDLRALNAVRLHLQVATLSDVCTADGRSFDQQAFQATPSTTRTSPLLWSRQPGITDFQRNLWQEALTTLLDKHNRLIKPLGPWHSEPNQQWQYYYNEETDSLLSQVHSPNPCEQFRTFPHGDDTFPSSSFFDKDIYPLDLPLNLHSLAPADATTDDDFTTIKYLYRRKSKRSHKSPPTQKSYVKALPKSRQRLLKVGRIRKSRTLNEFYALMMHTLTTGGNLNCGTDGGLKTNQGTFGLVVSVEDKLVWEGCGPVDGNPDTASSKRSELFGYAALLEFLLMVDSLMLTPTDAYPYTQVHTSIDNSSVVQQLQAFLKGYPPSREYPHDADILSHIRWLWTKLPRFQHKVSWVKAHQDDKTSFHLLDLPAQLNICADALATEYSKLATHPSDLPHTQPAFFPTSNVCLLVNSQRITAQYTATIRFHIHGTKHRAHLQKTRTGWKSDTVWENVDMQGLGIAFKSLDTSSRHFTSKMLHGWLNTGHQRKKITKDPNSSQCPCCQAPDETFEHILQCTAPLVVTARDKAQKKLSTFAKKSFSTTWKVLHEALCNWLKDGDKMKHPCLDKYYDMRPGLRQLLETALKNQDTIGWKYAMRGYFSTSWVDAEKHFQNGPSTDFIRQTWLKTIIKAMWVFNKSMWTHRNSILHSTSVPLRKLRESAVDSQIRHLYEQQSDFAVTDHILFDTPLDVRLQCPLRTKKHWIRLAQRYHPSTHDRKTGKQLQITSFFPSLSNPITARTNRIPKRQPKRTRPKRKTKFLKSSNQFQRRKIQLALGT